MDSNAAVAVVNGDPNERFFVTQKYEAGAYRAMLLELSELTQPLKKPEPPSTATLVTLVGKTLSRLESSNGPEQFRFLARNSLMVLGIPSWLGRTGDTSSRIDILLTDSSTFGVGELEQNPDLLDSIRRLITDVAVLVARKGLDRKALVPLIIPLRLPNRRSDAYELLADVRKRLELEVRTVPIGGLVIMVLTNSRSSLEEISEVFLTQSLYFSAAEPVAKLTGALVIHDVFGLRAYK
jgi:hypothetical protein